MRLQVPRLRRPGGAAAPLTPMRARPRARQVCLRLRRPTSASSSDSASDSVSDSVSDSDSDSDSVSVSVSVSVSSPSENAACWAEAEVRAFVAAAAVAAGFAEVCSLTFSCWMPVVTVPVLPSSLASCRRYFKSTQ